jgi:hypothetical protein
VSLRFDDGIGVGFEDARSDDSGTPYVAACRVVVDSVTVLHGPHGERR